MAASALNLVAAQRLVRRSCRHCLQEYEPSDDVLVGVGLYQDRSRPIRRTYRRGVGCAACKGRGFTGRIAIVEMMAISPALRQMIADSRPASDIRAVAIREGMQTLRGNGIQKAEEGTTTLEEVLRVCLSDE